MEVTDTGCVHPVPPLTISEKALERVLRYARRAGRDECLGLLASPLASLEATITTALLLPAEASPAFAEAEPLALHAAAGRLQRSRQRPRGLWHSHSASACYHSSTDRVTVAKLLPSMAEWNFVPHRGAPRAPRVTGPDSAELPAADGGTWEYTLQGPPLPEVGVFTPAAWASVETRFSPTGTPARAVQEGRRLRLEAGGVSLTLHVPEHATLQVREAPRTGFQLGLVYSLVVNVRGEHDAAALVVLDLDGRSLLLQEPCGLRVVAEGSLAPAGG